MTMSGSLGAAIIVFGGAGWLVALRVSVSTYAPMIFAGALIKRLAPEPVWDLGHQRRRLQIGET